VSVEFGIITSVVMPSGWHYPQLLSSGQTVKITAFGFEELLQNMLEFRMRHLDLCGAETASLEAVRRDLKVYICANFRQNCADSSGPSFAGTVGMGVNDYKRPIDRSGQWLAEVANHQVQHVDAALAAHRAQICAACPQNIRWATPCGPCNENVLVRIQNLNGSLRTPYDRNLFMCRIFGHVNEVAVWLGDTHSQPDSNPPANCWKVQENG
jgi:hypothetical protein